MLLKSFPPPLARRCSKSLRGDSSLFSSFYYLWVSWLDIPLWRGGERDCDKAFDPSVLEPDRVGPLDSGEGRELSLAYKNLLCRSIPKEGKGRGGGNYLISSLILVVYFILTVYYSSPSLLDFFLPVNQRIETLEKIA